MSNLANTSLHRERGVIIGSAPITILGGCTFVFMRWQLRHQLIDGYLRCVTLACSMIAVHAWGWNFYLAQGRTQWTRSVDDFLRHADMNWQILKRATPFSVVVLQVVTWFLAGLVLDGGDVFKLTSAALITYWGTILTLCFVRTAPLTRRDVFLLKYGFWLLLIPTGCALHGVWQLKGIDT
jgi:hypothetical protein